MARYEMAHIDMSNVGQGPSVADTFYELGIRYSVGQAVETDLIAATAMTKAAALAFDNGQKIAREAACAKLFATEAVGRIADRAVQIFGGAGYMSEYPIERIYRDVRLLRIYEGTSQIQQIIIAKSVLNGFGQGERH